MESSALTTLKIESYGESIFSDIRCPSLIYLKLGGPKHVHEDGLTILRRCYWLEQWEELIEERINEALKDSRSLTKVCTLCVLLKNIY